MCNFWGFYSEFRVCSSGKGFRRFRGTYCLHLPWRWRLRVPPKHRKPFPQHGIRIQYKKPENFWFHRKECLSGIRTLVSSRLMYGVVVGKTPVPWGHDLIGTRKL